MVGITPGGLLRTGRSQTAAKRPEHARARQVRRAASGSTAGTPTSLIAILRDARTAPLAPKRPGNRFSADDTGHLLAEVALQHRPPRHQRELTQLLDQSKPAAGEIQPAAVDALDRLAGLALDVV